MLYPIFLSVCCKPASGAALCAVCQAGTYASAAGWENYCSGSGNKMCNADLLEGNNEL